MVYVGIDVAKDKHDCFIANSDGEVLYDVFTIQNDMDGFEDLLFKIKIASRFILAQGDISFFIAFPRFP